MDEFIKKNVFLIIEVITDIRICKHNEMAILMIKFLFNIVNFL